jgi:hypothetical protein
MHVVRYNPLALLTAALVDESIQEGNIFFARQSYPRGLLMGTKEAFLFTPYNNMFQVTQHMKVNGQDPRAFVYDIRTTTDKQKLYIAASQPKGYAVYLNRLKDRKWECPRKLQNRLERFAMDSGMGELYTKVDFQFCLSFGKLVFKLHNHRGLRKEISLDDLDKLYGSF